MLSFTFSHHRHHYYNESIRLAGQVHTAFANPHFPTLKQNAVQSVRCVAIPRNADSGLTDIVTKKARPGILLACSALLLDSEPQRRKSSKPEQPFVPEMERVQSYIVVGLLDLPPPRILP